MANRHKMANSKDKALVELVKRAREGGKGCANQLAQKVKGRLYAYIYRATLDHDLSQDLSQEVLLTMVKSGDRLNNVESFWPWLYRIAQNKIRDHYREEQRRAKLAASALYQDFISQRADYHRNDGLRQLVQKELSKKVIAVMKQLTQRYRVVLSLRCFEQMSYSDIAVAMECNEVKARVLFFRAKQELKKQLSRNGVNKGLLLMCLGLFGRLTAPAEAASSTVTVAAASVKVGVMTALVATATTKLGIIAASLVAVGLASTGAFSIISEPPLPQRSQVKTIHYTVQSRNSTPGAVSSLSKGAYEQWFLFPEWIDGPVFTRMQRWDPRQKNKLCSWLQNGEANYYYHSGEKRIYINNYRIWRSNLNVRRLPSDTVELTSFLAEVEGVTAGVTYQADRATGMLMEAVDYRFVDAPRFQTTYSYNTLDESEFEYDWAADVPVADERDPMHRRGWTYFRIVGEIGGQAVSGRGLIPFVYNATREHPPWMTLNVGAGLDIIDCSEGARLRHPDSDSAAAYSAGTFFKGLPQPWMGFHSVDMVRRDAAKEKVWFETTPDKNQENVVVTLTHNHDNIRTNIIYAIDMENDLVKTVTFKTQNTANGFLAFSYLQEIDEVGDEFAQPALPSGFSPPTLPSPGMLWLIHLARGTLVL